MQHLDNKSKKSVSSVAKNVQSGDILSSSSEQSLCPERELFVICLSSSENKIGKAIKNYSDLFIDASLIYRSIRSCLVSQSNNKLISNYEQLLNTTNLLSITSGTILPLSPLRKNSIYSQIAPRN